MPDRFAWVRSPSGAFRPKRYFFGEIKDVDFGPGQLESDIVRTSADQALVRVGATGFNYFVRIPTPALQVWFSDNYLDLRDGDVAEIVARDLPKMSVMISCGRYPGSRAIDAPFRWKPRRHGLISRHIALFNTSPA